MNIIAIPQPVSRILTHLEFRRRFTQAERIAVDNYASNTSLTAAQKATFCTLLEDMRVASGINLDDPGTIMGVKYLEQCGLIAVGRAAEILA